MYFCPDAVAQIRGGAEVPGLSGWVRFFKEWGRVLVEVDVSGLPEDGGTGFFPLHIHEGGNCGGDGFSDTESHYDLAGKPHPEHSGDLPPLLCCGGRAYLAVRTNRFSVEEVIGRTVVIHSGTDDFRSQPSGDAGRKIACGVIVRYS